MPSFTWCSTANAVIYVGAQPVFADIDAHTLGLDPASVAAVVTAHTRAVIPVHFGGLGQDLHALAAALPAGVAVVEDAAHALGSTLPDGRAVGASGNLCCFSFYANKVLSTGDGGAIAVDDAALATRLRSLRLQGQSSDAWQRYVKPTSALMPPQIAELGLKANFTDLQAAIGRVQLRRQAEFAATRAAVAAVYGLALSDLGLRFQAGCDQPGHARHLFTVQLPPRRAAGRDALIAGLRALGIGASLHYRPLHRMPLYAGLLRGQALPQTETVARSILTLPIGPCMSVHDAWRSAQTLRQALGAAPWPRGLPSQALPASSSS